MSKRDYIQANKDWLEAKHTPPHDAGGACGSG